MVRRLHVLGKENGLNPEKEKKTPARECGCGGSRRSEREVIKGGPGDVQRGALFVNFRLGETKKKEKIHVTVITPTRHTTHRGNSSLLKVPDVHRTYVQSSPVLILRNIKLSAEIHVLGSEQGSGACNLLGIIAHRDFTFPRPFQVQFRLAEQRLSQLQSKFQSQAQITKGDIATLLRQGNVSLARAKAEGVIKDEIHTDLLQTLELYLGVVLEQFPEIEKKYLTLCN